MLRFTPPTEAVFLAIALLLGAPAHAADASSCPNGNLTDCTRYKQLVADINSGDIPTQLAALKTASRDLSDPSLRALLYDSALKSSDLTLRTAAIRYVISGRSTLNIDLELPPHPTDNQKRLYDRNPVLSFDSVKVASNGDEVSASAGTVMGNIIRGGLELKWTHCTLHLTGGDEAVLRGNILCAEFRQEPTELPATINLS